MGLIEKNLGRKPVFEIVIYFLELIIIYLIITPKPQKMSIFLRRLSPV